MAAGNGLPIEEIEYYFFPYENGEYEGEYNMGKNAGWNYVLKNKSRWIKAPMLTNLSQSCLQGTDFIIFNNKCYLFHKKYHILGDDATGTNAAIVITGRYSKAAADIIA